MTQPDICTVEARRRLPGYYNESECVAILAAIKRGRELEAAERG